MQNSYLYLCLFSAIGPTIFLNIIGWYKNEREIPHHAPTLLYHHTRMSPFGHKNVDKFGQKNLPSCIKNVAS